MNTRSRAKQDSPKPNPSPPAEDDVSEAGNIFQRSDDEEVEGGEANNSHIIPKSPEEMWKRSASMRGGRGGQPGRSHPRNKYSPPLSIGMPSWGSMEEHALEDYGGGETGTSVITPAVNPNMFRYPPNSPIKTSPSSRSPDEEFEGSDEFLPPQPSTRTRGSNMDTIKTARAMNEPPIHFPSEREPSIKPQFVRETKGSKSTPPRPSLVVDTSTSHDSAETPGRSLQGGRVQIVGGDASGAAWSLVSQSRSIESGEDWGVTASADNAPSPDRRYPPPPGYYRGPPGQPFPPQHGMPPSYPPGYFEREGWGPGPYPPPRYGYYPPPPGAPYPPPSVSVKQEEEDAHPLLKDYNPHEDSMIRPQFQNKKKTPKFASDQSKNADGPGESPRKRRRRNPEEKLASAAAMAAAATAAAARSKQKEQKIAAGFRDDDFDSEDEIKTVGSIEDEDLPAAKRAAMASAVALRAAAAGAPCPLPKAAAEVNFDIADPPMTPVHPPSITPVLESASQMGEHDVLCGRGGGTNSQMGNRRYRALVRDFQPTYLMARRREKPLMARSVVLVVRKRGGRFLRRDDNDGRLYEVGDEKAEAKTSQALREGLDVRATKTAANTLLGTENKKKKRAAAASSAAAALIKNEVGVKPAIQFERPKSMRTQNVKTPANPIHIPPKPAKYSVDRPTSFGGSNRPYPPRERYFRPPYPPYGPPGYPYPPPPYGYSHYPPPPTYGSYSTPPRSAGNPPQVSQTKEPNPFSPPRKTETKSAPLTPVHSKRES